MTNPPEHRQHLGIYRKYVSVADIRLFLLISLTLNLIVILVGFRRAYGVGSIFGFSGSRILALWPYFLLCFALVVLFAICQTSWVRSLLRIANFLIKVVSYLGILNLVLFLAPIIFYGYYRLSGWNFSIIEYFEPIWILGHFGLLGALFLRGMGKLNPSVSVLVSFSVYGVVLWVVRFIPDVNTYLLSLGWSETSRYYYASLFFGPLIYGKWVPLSSLHPSRYLMESLPFILPFLPLWIHRLWQVVLWLSTTFIAGVALSKRIKPTHFWIGFGLSAWFFMYCFQGPVYYHLMVVIIIVLLGFNKDRLWISLLSVGIASVWAGISRVNWFPVAGMLAVTLYVLEMPQGKQNFWKYWRWPILAVLLGLILAFLSQSIYTVISGNPPEVFASSFNSPLYRYRLFPNEAYGPGIINMTITVIFPLLVGIMWSILPRFKSWRPLRLLALLSILLALLAAGLVVSMKIGGGDNLHNLDSFLVVLAIIAAYIGFNRFQPDVPEAKSRWVLPIPLVVLAFLIPLIFVLDVLRPYPNLNNSRAWADIAQVQRLIDQRVPEGGEVLFIQHRHLLTFHLIRGVDLVEEYEKVFLMEMAMSGNAQYLNKFWDDLETHRFDLIISEPLNLITQTSSDVFGEENNVWVERVARPITESYTTILDLTESEMIVLAPKAAE